MARGRAIFRMASLAMVAIVLGACAGASPGDRLARKGPTPSSGNPATSATDGLATRLVGLSADEVRSRFGNPDVQRSEARAELWQYARSGCVVLIYLYPDASGSQVTHVDELSEPRTGKACAELMAAPAARAAALSH